MKLITEVRDYKKFLTLQERFITIFNPDILNNKQLFVSNLTNFIEQVQTLNDNLLDLGMYDFPSVGRVLIKPIDSSIIFREDLKPIYISISRLYTYLFYSLIYLQQTKLLNIKRLLSIEDIRTLKGGERLFNPDTICNLQDLITYVLNMTNKDIEDKSIFVGVLDILYYLVDIRKSLENVVPLSFNMDIIYKVFKDWLLIKLKTEITNLPPKLLSKYRNEAHFINSFFNDSEFHL